MISTDFPCLAIVQSYQSVDSGPGTSHTFCDTALCHQMEERAFYLTMPLHQLHLETLQKMNVSQKGDSTHCLEHWLGVKALGDRYC